MMGKWREESAEEEIPIPLPLPCLPSLNSTFSYNSSSPSSTGDFQLFSSSSRAMIAPIIKSVVLFSIQIHENEVRIPQSYSQCP